MLVDINKRDICTDKIGNKAKFLFEMKKSGFNVPSLIVLDSDTYDDVIKYNKLVKRMDGLLNLLNVNNVSNISNRIGNLFNSFTIPDELMKEIKSKLNPKKKYAVRSSGTKEDLNNFSFAGQYETFLNVSIDDIESKIILCYKSMFSEVILNYLVNNNISFSELKMSVIIQEMVNSEYSGICFTINPMTGNDKEMLIEVSKGLGEDIVSGKTIPEQYHFDWYENKVSFDKKNKLLNKKKLMDIADVFLKIQLHFGYPCDIEFAVNKNRLYILQAREITSIKYSGIKDIWSTADFKDGGVSATICKPYMWSLYEYIWEFTLRKYILDSKILKNKELPKKLGNMYFARCYWNMSAVKKAMSKIIGYREREFDSEYGVKINYEGEGNTTKITPKSLFRIIRIALVQSKIVKVRKDNALKYKNDLLDKYYFYKELYDKKKISNIEEVWYKLTKDVYLQSESTYFWQIFLNTVHQSLYKDSLLKYVSEIEYLSLLGSIDNISHLLPFYEMWDISRKIREDDQVYDYWYSNDSKVIEKNLHLKKNCFEEVSELINKYGYHSDKELDITYPCYYEEKHVMIQMIKDMISLDDKFSPLNDKEKGIREYEEILQRIKDNVSSRKFKKIEGKIVSMRKMLWWREEFRDISTRFYYILRVYTIEYAKYLKKKNVISSINDIWYLKVSDLWDYIDKKKSASELQKSINKNKVYYNSYRNFMSENEIGAVFSEGEDVILKKNSSVIKGIGANNGKVTGVARVINDFSEISRLQKDDILITKYTDTGWTAKFAILSGIVTEYGGILCHAAIVSREYGIPAIVCCHDVMSKVKDGQIITINGATGEVKIKE